MKTKAIITVAAIALLAGGVLLVARNRSRPPVTVTLRIAVNPGAQSGFVADQANSARFKYLMSKQSGVKPFLAQKLLVKAVPNSPFLEARLGVLSKDEGRRYTEAFVATLQALCGKQVQLGLADQSVR